MRSTIAPLAALVLVIGAAAPARATHVAAAEILYQCTGENQYLITLNLYRDCVGSALGTSYDVSIDNPCGGVQTVTVTRILVQEVSQLCADELANSTCNGGIQPGIERHTYTGTVILTPCDHVTFSYALCCRNGAIDNIFVDVASTDMYVETTMYSQSFPCDDSPVFNSSPIPYLCAGYPVSYGFGTTEANGDILRYTFVEALEASGVPTSYNTGYSFDQPLPGMVIDSLTGQLTFTPTVTGNFVVTVMVTQYDADGNIIGTVMRDMQFVVIPCNNVPPDPTTGVVENLTGGALQPNSYIVDACHAESFCFDITIVDPDTGQTVTLQSNIDQALPGATFTWSGTNPVTGTICWTIPPGNLSLGTFQILATDDACPVTAFSSYVYSIYLCPPPIVEIPNVFTPNGDGENDAFYFIEFYGFRNYRLQIFNRWGMTVHEETSMREDHEIWRPGFEETPDGTYFYVFTGTTSKGQFVDKTGHITLLR